MNQHDAISHPDERDFNELWESLKQLTPPLEMRIANREAVAIELSQALRARRTRRAFWRRTIELPWPIVAATIAILFGLSASVVRLNGLSNERTIHVHANPKNASAPSNATPSDDGIARRASRHSMTYLCGIGTLRTEVQICPEENEP